MSNPLLIRETPSLVWDASEDHTVRLALTPRAALDLSDYGTFTLTIREDPDYPRTGAARATVSAADPINDGWAVAATGTATAAALDTTVDIDVTVPDGAGDHRYCVDVTASGGTAGRVTVFRTTWLSVAPTLAAG